MSGRQVFVLMAGLSLVGGCRLPPAKTVYQPKTRYHEQFAKQIVKTVGYRYVVFFPAGYGTVKESWPTILFLHGAGERGDDLNKVTTGGLLEYAASQPDFPFVVVVPQCPKKDWWDVDTLNALLDEVLAKYSIDPDRLYLTGLSMGGYGTWSLGIAHPERFAALAPLCGGGIRALVKRIKPLPVWVFHGAKDNVVPIEYSQRLVDALRACGSNVEFTIYPDAGHDCWTPTYRNPKLYDWFLQHRRQHER